MGKVEYINPAGVEVRGYTNAIVVSGHVKTIYIGGQNAVNAEGKIEGDLKTQVLQIFKNMETLLAAADATPENVVKWNILAVEGTSVEEAFEVYQQTWGKVQKHPPAITVAFVAGLGRPGALVEIEAIAVIPE